MALTAKEEKELLRLIKDEEDYFKYNKLDVYFGEEDYIPMKGKPILSKASYSKHWNFI